MEINVSYPKQTDFKKIKPETKINTLMLFNDYFPTGLLCDIAWTNSDFRYHFWFKGIPGVKKEKCKILKMSLLEYLQELFKDGINPANPFQAQAQKKWLDTWEQYYGPLNVDKHIPVPENVPIEVHYLLGKQKEHLDRIDD